MRLPDTGELIIMSPYLSYKRLYFINIYKNNRQKDDDFETIEISNLNVYVMTDTGKTIQIYRS